MISRSRFMIPSSIALATQIGGQDARMAVLTHRAQALWLLGYPEAALADAERGLRYAREVGNAATLMYALNFAARVYRECGKYTTAKALVDELIVLADEKGSTFWKAGGTVFGRHWNGTFRAAHIWHWIVAMWMGTSA
jgi:hypothetical protein